MDSPFFDSSLVPSWIFDAATLPFLAVWNDRDARFVIARDITKLRESEERYRDLFRRAISRR